MATHADHHGHLAPPFRTAAQQRNPSFALPLLMHAFSSDLLFRYVQTCRNTCISHMLTSSKIYVNTLYIRVLKQRAVLYILLYLIRIKQAINWSTYVTSSTLGLIGLAEDWTVEQKGKRLSRFYSEAYRWLIKLSCCLFNRQEHEYA